MKKIISILALLIAAPLLCSTTVWAKDKNEVKLPTLVNETYEEVLVSVPQLKQYNLTSVEKEDGRFELILQGKEKGQYRSAAIIIDEKSGDMDLFTHISSVEQSQKQPSDEMAKERATKFLKEIWGEQLQQYQFTAVEPADIAFYYVNEKDEEIDVDRDAKRVVFTSINDKDSSLSVLVEASGEIYRVEKEEIFSESKLDEKVKQTAQRLLEAVPEMKEETYHIGRSDNRNSKWFKGPLMSQERDVIRYVSESSNKVKLIFINNRTGELTSFSLLKEREKSNNSITKEVAKEKAAHFIQQVMKDSDKYKFVGSREMVFGDGYVEIVVGFTTPLPEDIKFVKHLKISVDQDGKIAGATTRVEEANSDFQEYYEEGSPR